MSVSQTLPRRIVLICTLVVLGVSLAGGIIYLLPLVIKLTPGQDISWINYVTTRKTIWKLPIELYITIVSLILITVRRSTSWSIVWNTVLFAITLGIIRNSLHDILLWIMIVASIIALCVSSTSFEGGWKVFLQEFFDNIKQFRQKPSSVWKILAVTLAIAFVFNFIHSEIIRQTSEEVRDTRLVEWYKSEKNKTNTADEIKVKIFTDYQCPACSQLVPVYLKVAQTAGNDTLQIELRDYPLDAACNVLSMSSPHPAACSAAYAARLMDKEMPNKSSDFKSWLYDNRSKLNDDVILQQLKELGVDCPQDMFDSEIKQAVLNDVQEARTYGIMAVPAVVLNNVMLPTGLTPTKLELLLKSEMAGNNDFTQ